MGETEFMQRGVWEIMMVAAEAMHSVLAVRRKGGETDRPACSCTVEDPAAQSNEAHHNRIIMALHSNVRQKRHNMKEV